MRLQSLFALLAGLPVAMLALCPYPVDAATVQTFDGPGTGYQLLQIDNPPGAELVAGPSGNLLRLVPGAGTTPIHNTIAFDRSDPGPFCGMSAEFDFRITPGTGRADGMGFALLDTAVYHTRGQVGVGGPLFASEEPSFPRSLGIGFDVFQNAEAADPDANHLSVHFDGARLTQVPAGGVDLASGQMVHAQVVMTTGATPSVTVTLTPAGGGAVTVINAFPVPGLEPYEGRAWFGARGGGLTADHDLDNVNVTYTACPASEVGAWSAPFPLPVVSIHAHLLPTGKVLFWDRDDASDGDGDPRLYDPQGGGVTLAPLAPGGHDLFCSGHVLLPDGRLFVPGGHVIDGVGQDLASIFDPATGLWQAQPMMNAGRWYPTAVMLANGDVFVASGRTNQKLGINTVPQVWQRATGTWRTLPGAEQWLPLYPYLFLAPDGRVFTAGPQAETGYFDPAGTGSYSKLEDSKFGFREYGSAVLYDDGKIMIAGGGDPPVDAVEVIDLAATKPEWRTTTPMAYRRRQHNLTLLPDGSVLATGGSAAPGFNSFDGSVYPAELWDPVAETWRTAAAGNEARLYHSEALLLPDATVLVAGGGHPNGGGDDQDHFSAEIYSPPYLSRGPRPVISAAPHLIHQGESFFLAVQDPGAVAAVTVIRLSSVTHALNMNQRINRLPFIAVAGGLRVTAPANPNLGPPGHYLLFALSADGVPSLGRMVRLGTTAVFADGFESGSTAAWSQTVP